MLSAVLLPLRNLEAASVEAAVGPAGARIKITDPNATWTVETIPMGRVMLPNGDVLIINGAQLGGGLFCKARRSSIPRMYTQRRFWFVMEGFSWVVATLTRNTISLTCLTLRT